MNFFNKLYPASVTTSDMSSTLTTINNVLSAALGILTAGIVILAIFIAYKFFTADDKDKRANAKQQLIYAIIGVIVLIALLIFVPNITSYIGSALA